MKMSENFNSNEMEFTFVQLTHFDELEIKFDFIEYDEYLFFCNKMLKDWLFIYNNFDFKFYINYDRIWRPIENKYNLKYDNLEKFFDDMVKKYFNIVEYDIVCAMGYKFFLISDYMKNNI